MRGTACLCGIGWSESLRGRRQEGMIREVAQYGDSDRAGEAEQEL